ncbi:MAG TPA: cyclopropane-fatty-acyl-phospholipid synthase family protein [Hyphomicrobium sp.]|jgi:cyclopropane-fatty-acyl-phospholipid synthase|nr:cyclopropane-fatty-acyl-phospholipid synthase family protein [Hyphomicrobium sp.]
MSVFQVQVFNCFGRDVMAVALRSHINRCIKHGSLILELPRGEQLAAGDGSGLPIIIRLKDNRAVAELLLNPELALGELYTDGRLIVSGGSVYDFLDLLGRNIPGLLPPQIGRWRHAIRTGFDRWRRGNSERIARRNVHHHYDIDDRIYSLFLDPDRQYSCAYFESERQNLEHAQLAKKRHLAAKLLVSENSRVLDIGCGWGGLALYLAELCGVDVTGVTLSPEQLKVAERRAQEKDLNLRVHFRLEDYRAVTETFDRIVSVGMFEHVGFRNYETFFGMISRSLKPDGIALLHSIGRLDGQSATNPWIAKHIFPGGYMPSLAEVLPAVENSGLIVTDIEILRLHYADTLAAWRSRFLSHRAEAAAVLGERFCRMWEFYLAGSEVGFRYGGLMVFQMQLAKKIDTVPRTRNYIAEEESRLRKLEQAGAKRGVAVRLVHSR